MDFLIDFVKITIQQYGTLGIFTLTTLEQFIFPVPADIFIAIGGSVGLPFEHIIPFVLLGALLGSYIGYFLGKWLGHPFMEWLFGKTRLEKGEKFIKKYGVWGVIVAALTPIPFKIVTWTAGIFEMPLGKYTFAVIVGRMPRYLIASYAASWIYRTKFYASYEMSAILLGTLQGITEFLPISSSGHLALVEHFIKLPANLEAGNLIIFDIFLHGGSLLAILIYFWKDWLVVLKEIWKSLSTLSIKKDQISTKLAIATIPAIIAGLAFGNHFDIFRNPKSISLTFILVGLFFIYAERKGRDRNYESVGFKKGLIIGLAQSLALIPGVSRAGTTIATGTLLGIKREMAAKFSFLLGGIAILAANVYGLISLKQGAAIPPLSFTLIGAATSFVVSLLSVHFLMKYLKNHSLRVFSAYLIAMGILILSFF